jgi:amino acid permease
MESGGGRLGGGTETGVDVFAETDDEDANADAPLVTHGTNEAPPRDASFLVSTFNLANCAVGAGVLSVPFAVSELGVALAALVLPLVAAVVVFTLKVLLRASDVYGAVSYQELVRKALGPGAAHAVSVTLIAYIAGSCVAYTIIVADAFASVAAGAGLLNNAQVAGAFGVERTVVILVTSVCVLLPLSLLRRTKHLAPTSAVTVMALSYTAYAVVAEFARGAFAALGDARGRAEDDGTNATDTGASMGNFTRHEFHDANGTDVDGHHEPTDSGASWWFKISRRGAVGSAGFRGGGADLWRFDERSVLALPILVFAFQCHIQVLSIYAELREERARDPGARAEESGEDAEDAKAARRRTMGRVATAATTMCLVGYLAVGACAYLSHPDIESNMLKSYDASDPYMLVATVGMGLSAIGSYPMNHFSARAALDDVLAASCGWTPAAPGTAPAARHVSQTLAFVLATTATALAVEDLGKVFQLVGSTAGVLVICWVPAALLLVPPPAEAPSPVPGAADADAAFADERREARGTSRRGGHSRRARSTHWTDGGGSIGGIDELPLSGLAGGVEDLAPAEATDGLDAPLLATSGAGTRFGTDPVSGNREVKRRDARARDAWRGLGLVLLGLVIAVSNVYVLFFTGEEHVTGEDPPPEAEQPTISSGFSAAYSFHF